MDKLRLIQVGDSLGVILPPEVLARLKLKEGDFVHLTEVPEGVALTPYDPAFEEQIARGREFMHEYRETFRALAK